MYLQTFLFVSKRTFRARLHIIIVFTGTCVLATVQMPDGPHTQNLVWMSRMIALHMHQKDMERFVTHIRGLSSEGSMAFPGQSQNDSREREKRLSWGSYGGSVAEPG